MGIFDYLIREVDQQFNVDNKAKPLLSRLLGEITDETKGGLAAFLDKFKIAGLGNLANSWISSGDPAPLSQNQLEAAVGEGWLDRLSSLAGLPAALASPALAYMIPKVISALTPDGIIPSFLPDSVREYLGGVAAPAAAASGSEVVEEAGLRNPLGLLGMAALLLSILWALLAPKPPAPQVTVPSPVAVEKTIDFTEIITQSRLKTLDALNALKPGAYKADDVVTILNGLIIHFDTDSAEIAPDYTDVLQKSAGAIKSLPADSVIEIAGYTDNEGDDAANMDLSKRRAEAVLQKLTEYGVDPKMLKAEGYGETQPKADNSTEQGRFENRRIQYKIIKIVP